MTLGVSAAAESSKKALPGPREVVARESNEPASSDGAEAGAAPGGKKVAVENEGTAADGEKSYQFQAIEVEGRLKAPQILYFLRRVRAELRAGRLGHRSFMPELLDTRRNGALR